MQTEHSEKQPLSKQGQQASLKAMLNRLCLLIKTIQMILS